MQNVLKVVQIGSRYSVETQDGKMHILNLRALKWNLKNVFGIHGRDLFILLNELEVHGDAQLVQEAA